MNNKMARLLGALLVLASAARCWHGNGHYLVAYIAQAYLLKTNPEALKWATDLLAPFTEQCGESLYPFVEAATWADKIKDQGWHLFETHHYVPNAWFDQGAQPYAYDPSPEANAAFAIRTDINTLSATQEDPYGSSKSLLGRSLSLRTLIHYTGDIHQPLHAEERVTPGRPDGDQGGNLFLINHYGNPAIDNLHFVWDEMFEDLAEGIRSNLPPKLYLFIKRRAEDIMAEHPFDRHAAQIHANYSATLWAQEGFEIAKAFAYKSLQENAALPAEYLEQGRRICRERVALGGYRLGLTLSDIYAKISAKKTLAAPAPVYGLDRESAGASPADSAQAE